MSEQTTAIDNIAYLSSAADHGRMVLTEPAKPAKKAKAIYRSQNLTIYYRPGMLRHDHLVTSGDWNV
jgi:hypothetical protein